MYDFEFDIQKSTLNFEKHGIDFVDAQELWTAPNLIEIPANTSDEPRFLVIGTIDNKHRPAVITYRKKKSSPTKNHHGPKACTWSFCA